MPVDMLLSRYFQELNKVIPSEGGAFHREGWYDADMFRRHLPPYRQIFHGLCLVEHSRGYRLPQYQEFRWTYLDALFTHSKYQSEVPSLFVSNDKARPELLYRIGGWYLDGLRHTHLYCALVQAFEEQRRIGVVLMDARADVKLKADLLIVTLDRVARVSIEAGTGQEQKTLIARRAAAEQEAKAHNQTSSQKDNPLHEGVFTASIAREKSGGPTYFGVPLFSGEAINSLIRKLDDYLGVPPNLAITYDQMKGLNMEDLNRLNNAGRIPRFPPVKL